MLSVDHTRFAVNGCCLSSIFASSAATAVLYGMNSLLEHVLQVSVGAAISVGCAILAPATVLDKRVPETLTRRDLTRCETAVGSIHGRSSTVE